MVRPTRLIGYCDYEKDPQIAVAWLHLLDTGLAGRPDAGALVPFEITTVTISVPSGEYVYERWRDWLSSNHWLTLPRARMSHTLPEVAGKVIDPVYRIIDVATATEIWPEFEQELEKIQLAITLQLS